MADPKGFLKYDRETPPSRPIEERIRDYREIYVEEPEEHTRQQAARCMD
jgi:glutamate synthase (NADPH/NADH) small chain